MANHVLFCTPKTEKEKKQLYLRLYLNNVQKGNYSSTSCSLDPELKLMLLVLTFS